ncbi:MAG: hypothetical protein ACRC4M_00700, partial [Mycoplasma sp.]
MKQKIKILNTSKQEYFLYSPFENNNNKDNIEILIKKLNEGDFNSWKEIQDRQWILPKDFKINNLNFEDFLEKYSKQIIYKITNSALISFLNNEIENKELQDLLENIFNQNDLFEKVQQHTHISTLFFDYKNIFTEDFYKTNPELNNKIIEKHKNDNTRMLKTIINRFEKEIGLQKDLKPISLRDFHNQLISLFVEKNDVKKFDITTYKQLISPIVFTETGLKDCNQVSNEIKKVYSHL